MLAAEAELAEEQAAVNAFRMHCRLKLDDWINQLLELQMTRQRLLTRLTLLRQAEDIGVPFNEDDPFWQGVDSGQGGPEEEEELILPTDVPRDKAAEQRLFRQLARKFHPDLGVTAVEIAYRTEMMTAVNVAYEEGDLQALYDLAGELDPQEAADLAGIESREIRELRTRIVRLKQRRRRARRRLANLREENTARLWQKAQQLESSGASETHWWEVVRREIDRAIGRLQRDVDRLNEQIETLTAMQARAEEDGRKATADG